MKTKTETIRDLWLMARMRFATVLDSLTEEDLHKSLPPTVNSIGFLVRHIGEVELMFAGNFFGAKGFEIGLSKHADRNWTDLSELKEYLEYTKGVMLETINSQSEEDWDKKTDTRIFGILSYAELIGRIASHNAYHAGQMALIKKYGV